MGYGRQWVTMSERTRSILVGGLLLFGLYLTRLYSYLLFHSLAELFSIVVAFSIFVIFWNSRRFLKDSYFLFLGIAYLFIGILDLIHMLAYKGMGVFAGYDANLPTQLWISARYLESLSLLAASLLLGRRLKSSHVFFGFGVVIVLLLSSIFYWGIFPDCYIEGSGLTWFKKISEYVISTILLASIAVLYRRRRAFDAEVLRLMVASILVTIAAELSFTFYVGVSDVFNLTGHLLKIISFYLIYRALIHVGLAKPYTLLFRDLKRHERALREEMDRVQEYLDIAGTVIVAHEPDGRVSLINRRGCELLGYEEEELVGRKWFDDFIPAQDRDRVKAGFDAMMAGQAEQFEFFEHSVLTSTGEERIIAWHNKPVRDEAGNIVGSLSSGEDVTERRLADAELRKLSRAVNQSPSVVVITGPSGTIEYVNPRFTELTGYSAAESIGNNPRLLKSGEHPVDFYRHLWATILAGEEWRGELRNRRKNGELYWESCSISPIRDSKGAITHFVKVAEDITERKRAEERIHASLQEKEVLLQEIHHRVKNNLQVISSLLDMQSGSLGDPAAVQALQDSRNRVRAMAFVHERLYQSEDLASVNAEDYVQSIARYLFGAHAKKAAGITLNVQVDDVDLDLDTAIPCGLLINELVSNALKYAFPAEGEREGEIRVGLCALGDGRLALSVSDNGTGLPPDAELQNIESLGLRLVDMLTQQLRGTIELDRSAGTAFRITFAAQRAARQMGR